MDSLRPKSGDWPPGSGSGRTDLAGERRSHVFPRVFGRDLPVVDHARGARIYDRDGKVYIDGAGGALVVGVGHGDQSVIDALEEQARRVGYVHGTQFRSESLESYAAEVAGLLPMDGARIYPVSGGSEAIETALKIARAYHLATGETGRYKVIARAGSYHGNTLNALDASGRASLRAPYEPWLGRTIRVPAPNEYRCPRDAHKDCGRELADDLDAVIRREGSDTVACFIAEPIVGAALGAMLPPPDYWPAIVEVCREHGVLLIADEVMTGFGRTGAWFASEHFGLRPDILTAGKGASSGYWPFGFAACSGAVFDAIERTGFVHGFTFSHSAVGAAVASAVLQRLSEGKLVEASGDKGQRLKSMIGDALGDHPNLGDVRGRGLMIGVELVADRATKGPFERSARITESLVAKAFELGLIVYPASGCADGKVGDAIMFGPPFVITDDEIEQAVGMFTDALADTMRLSR
jgi:adenosylmethionine-8-amino-7-oxononanoate aminotransferase